MIEEETCDICGKKIDLQTGKKYGKLLGRDDPCYCDILKTLKNKDKMISKLKKQLEEKKC